MAILGHIGSRIGTANTRDSLQTKTFLPLTKPLRIWKMDVETVRRWLRSGQLRGLKFGRMWRIPAGALIAIATVPEQQSGEVFPAA